MPSASLDLQDKDFWCEAAELDEDNFIKIDDFHLIDLLPNRDKSTDKFTYDIRLSFPADLKTIRSAWIFSQRMFGISPRYAVSLNRKDVERYNELYPNIIIVMDIEFPDYKRVHWTDLTRVNRLISRKIAKEHHYKERTDDVQGNAKSSYVFDCRWFPVLEKREI